MRPVSSLKTQLYVLFEHAAGYALFRVKEFEDVGSLLPQVEQSVTDLSRFNGVVKLAAFAPFKSAGHALDNINSVSEGIMSEDLHLFLETNLPKEKDGGLLLGVAEPKLGAAITESLSVSCSHIGAVPEIIRGIRRHFPHLVKGPFLFPVTLAASVQCVLIRIHGFIQEINSIKPLFLTTKPFHTF